MLFECCGNVENSQPKTKKSETLLAREKKAMQGPYTAAQWARIARSTKGQDLWWSHSLTRLSVNQIAVYNERGHRCAEQNQENPTTYCGRLVEYRAYSSQRGFNGHKPSHRVCYLCPCHAEQFAQIYGLDWPPYMPKQYRGEE